MHKIKKKKQPKNKHSFIIHKRDIHCVLTLQFWRALLG